MASSSNSNSNEYVPLLEGYFLDLDDPFLHDDLNDACEIQTQSMKYLILLSSSSCGDNHDGNHNHKNNHIVYFFPRGEYRIVHPTEESIAK
mmetsp:Transcript_4409/g.6481  ORF Transcript_4409/g.6481 Transcript_4409/m.6481 type:complete len:91 (+) Transcript_4409:855-1127(+)